MNTRILEMFNNIYNLNKEKNNLNTNTELNLNNTDVLDCSDNESNLDFENDNISDYSDYESDLDSDYDDNISECSVEESINTVLDLEAEDAENNDLNNSNFNYEYLSEYSDVDFYFQK